ncbi:uncharacterized protein PV07_03326 [Cladophialophora immunda]|uniref:Enoyl-CoA hydratase n=1 Tax=Cladophialophora immunda TaxID=569365 RepID=A0A0D1ZUC6_9EURO|nr:uncharacterized protein PV07_03326 [Cladophialophora immunda]KIW31726.1 hypothetical protein PV07_03326 [Cladophialophora immunda]
MSEDDTAVVSYSVQGKFAIVTLNNPKRLNALTTPQFARLAGIMTEIDGLDQVLVTVLTGVGRFFSAGANLASREPQTDPDTGRHWLQTYVARNIFLTDAFSTHSKIIVAALNGPAVGGGAAVAAFADFAYATPLTYLLTPFASLGLVAEVGTSYTLVQKLGISLANEALLVGRKISSAELVRCGFVNKIIPADGEMFLPAVMKELNDQFGHHLNLESVLCIKALINRPSRKARDMQNVSEVFAVWRRLTLGVFDREVDRMQSGQKRHKM